MHLSVGVNLNSGEKSVPFLVKIFFSFLFWSLPEFGEKSVPFLVRTFFLGLHLICSPDEQNRGRGSSPPMLKIGQNWGKIANYPPQCSTEIGTPDCQTDGPANSLHASSYYSENER